MPSIELVCIDQDQPLECAGFPFAVVADRELVSHRTNPLFQRELSQLRGCMYHVGNPQCAEPGYNGFFFAYELLSLESRDQAMPRVLEVAKEFRESLGLLVRRLLDASPAHSVFFYTDWQFGPRRPVRGGTLLESVFWQRHDKHRLRLNACYTIQREGLSCAL